jgi:hypothetical protein
MSQRGLTMSPNPIETLWIRKKQMLLSYPAATHALTLRLRRLAARRWEMGDNHCLPKVIGTHEAMTGMANTDRTFRCGLPRMRSGNWN